MERPVFRKLRFGNVLAVEYKCFESSTISKIWSHHNYMVHITEGKKIWKTKNGEFLLSKGDTAFISKGCNFKKQLFEGDFTAIFLFIPDKEILSVKRNSNIREIPNFKQNGNDVVIPLDHDLMLDSFFLSLSRIFRQIDIPPIELLDSKLSDLIIHIWSTPMHTKLAKQFELICHSRGERTKQIMEANFTYPLLVEEFASICNRSVSSFNRDFHSLYKSPPGRWLMHKRLEHSKKLLLDSKKGINDVAQESGFEKASIYINAYKKKYKTSPGSGRN